MLVHAVYFWLKPDLSEQQKQAFSIEVDKLRSIPSVRHAFIGKPADTDRPVIDRSYSVALTVVFDDMAGHDAYQVDPIHQQFVSACSSLWDRVLIYDSVEG